MLFHHNPDKLLLNIKKRDNKVKNQIANLVSSAIAFLEISAWTTGVISYAFLGLNRCVAICFYGTKAKVFNRVTIALLSSLFTWIIGILIGIFFAILKIFV